MSSWLSDNLANRYKNTYFYDRNETGTTVEISGNVFLRGAIIAEAAMPVGSILMWNGTYNSDGTIADYNGWYICDGSNNTPDLRGRFILGSTNGSSLDVTGEGEVSYSYSQTGGSQSHVLTESEIPSHSHGVVSGGSHNHYVYIYNVNGWIWATNYTIGHSVNWNERDWTTAASGNHQHTIQSTGSGEGHENRPPYCVLGFIMRIN